MTQTNKLFQDAGNQKFSLTFLNYNDATTFGDAAGPVREYGDIRYSFIHFVPDIEANTGWLGYGPSAQDPRTGETLNASVNLAAGWTKSATYELDFYLQTIGASQGLGYANAAGTPQDWPAVPPNQPAKCTIGQTVPLDNSVIQSDHNGNSSMFTKMQQYLDKPSGTYGNLGPQDFIVPQDEDFFNAYYTLIPYAIFADPDMNAFVVREGGKGIYGPANFWDLMKSEVQFQQIAGDIDRGLSPYEDVTGPNGLANATAFINNFRTLTQNHTQLEYEKHFITRQQAYDTIDPTALPQVGAHAARHCIATVGGGTHWETKDEWVNDALHSFYGMVAIHEFGHTLGLAHNFMGSVDQPNYPVRKDDKGQPMKDANGNPVYAMYANSVMEYTSDAAWVFDQLGWGAYDKGALSWAYTNNAPKMPAANAPTTLSITGQLDATTPWNDTHGFQADGKTEIQLLFCHDQHMQYTPFCRTWDTGSTPSEIIANAIDNYEWQYHFTNFRVYRKFWDNSFYANIPADLMNDMRRFLMLWVFDWNSGELADTLRRIGNQDPAGIPALQYYTQLDEQVQQRALDGEPDGGGVPQGGHPAVVG